MMRLKHVALILVWALCPAHLRAAPLIEEVPEEMAVRLQGTLRLSVQARGTPPLRYQWQRNGRDLPGANRETLRKGRMTYADAGVYQVRVTDSSGTNVSMPIPVQVLALPRVVQHPRSIQVGEGSNAVFRVEVTGDNLSLRWWHRDHAIPLREGDVTNRVYVIPDVLNTYDYNGHYWVEVANPVGTVRSRAAVLKVLSPPRLSVELEDAYTRLGGSGVFTIKAAPDTAGPKTYQWFKDGAAIPNANAATLHVHHVAWDDAGFYLVEVRSRGGATTSLVKRLIVEEPEAR